MSSLENDRIEEALFESFVELYDTNETFRELIRDLWTFEESWNHKHYGREDEEALGRIFNELWNYDAEALFYDKVQAVENYLINQMGKKINA